MTYLQFVEYAKKKYETKNLLVVFEIIFNLSKKVKNKIDFTDERNKKIDFDKKEALKCLEHYFVKQKPLGHIVKHINFLGAKICVHQNIFEPRAETEELT
jgi:release factor glutamine methyltransferase